MPPIVCSIVGYYEEMSEKFANSGSLFSGPLRVGTPGVTFHGENVSQFLSSLSSLSPPMSVFMLLCISFNIAFSMNSIQFNDTVKEEGVKISVSISKSGM